MKLPPKTAWLIVVAASAAAAGISAAVVLLSAAEGNALNTVIAVAALVVFLICALRAWTVRSRMTEVKVEDEEVSCLKLKSPGIEKNYDEVIVPKGKMPKE